MGPAGLSHEDRRIIFSHILRRALTRTIDNMLNEDLPEKLRDRLMMTRELLRDIKHGVLIIKHEYPKEGLRADVFVLGGIIIEIKQPEEVHKPFPRTVSLCIFLFHRDTVSLVPPRLEGSSRGVMGGSRAQRHRTPI